MQGRPGIPDERHARLGAALVRFAVYGVPALAIATAAMLFLGPGRPRGSVGLRLRGDLVEGATALALRVEGVRRASGVDDAVALEGLVIEASAGGEPLGAWRGALDREGLAEARLQASGPIRGPVQVRALHGAEVLVEGEIAPRSAALRVDEAPLARVTQAGRQIELRAMRGQLVAPFVDALRVRVVGSAETPRAVRVALTARGATVSPGESALDAQGEATFSLRPTMLLVGLSLTTVDTEGRSATVDVDLPVVAGAMNVRARGEAIEVGSAAPRERAYLSFVGPEGRWAGATVDLRERGGLRVGEVDGAWLGAAPRPLYAVVSADPYEQGSGVVAWPLDPPHGHLEPPRVRLLLDGVPGVEARERARSREARLIGVVVLGLAGLAEALLLVLRARASARALAAHLAQEALGLGEGDRSRLVRGGGDHPALYALALTSLVGLGFAVVAGLAMLR